MKWKCASLVLALISYSRVLSLLYMLIIDCK